VLYLVLALIIRKLTMFKFFTHPIQIFCFAFFFLIGKNGTAQPVPYCSATGPQYIYYIQGQFIMQYDPLLPGSPTNPIATTVPVFGGGLAVANNLNGGTFSPTFYGTSGTYSFWDG